MYQRCSTPTQARCHSEADLREAAKLSTSRRQNSVHGGPCSIRSRRRSAENSQIPPNRDSRKPGGPGASPTDRAVCPRDGFRKM